MMKKLFITLLGTLCMVPGFSQEQLSDDRVSAQEEVRIPKIVGDAEVCAGGAFSVFGLDTVPENCRIQWFVDGEPQLHENASTFSYKSSYDANWTSEIGCVVQMMRQVHEHFGYDYWTYDTVQLRSFMVTNALCCEDPKGKPVSRRLVWREDFGKFYSEDTYIRSDYSDPSSVTSKVCHADSAWFYCVDGVVPSATCAQDVSEENTYLIAAHVPNKENLIYVDSSEYFLDHTEDSEFGGALFVHLNAHSDTVVYSTTISGLCDQYFISYSARFYARAMGEKVSSPKLFFRIIDLASGDTVVATKKNNIRHTSEFFWSSYWTQFDLTGNSLRLEIVTTRDYLREVEDVVFALDDIQLWECAPHAPYLSGVGHMSNEVVGNTSGNDAGLEPAAGVAASSEQINFFVDGVNGYFWTVENQCAVVQYTLTPDDLTSWKTANDPSDYENVIAEHGSVFFRYVIGPTDMVSTSVVNPGEVCSPFSVSNVVEYSEKKSDPKVFKPVVDDIVVCEGGLQYLTAFFGLDQQSNLYYKWYRAEFDSAMTGERIKTVNMLKPGDDFVSFYEYYVSVCDRKTGEESEKVPFQVFVFSTPNVIPEHLTVCDPDIDIVSALSPSSTSGYVYSLAFFDQERDGNLLDADNLTDGAVYVVQSVKPLRHLETCRSDRKHLELDLQCSKPDVSVTENESEKCAEVQFSPVDGAAEYRFNVFDDDWSLIYSETFPSEDVRSDKSFFYSSKSPLIHYVFDVYSVLGGDWPLAYRTVGSYQNSSDPASVSYVRPENESFVYVSDGGLSVFCGMDGMVMVTNALGQVVSSVRGMKGETLSFRLPKGVYFVYEGESVVKVLVD